MRLHQSTISAGVTKREGRKEGKERSEIHDLSGNVKLDDDFGGAKSTNIVAQLYPSSATRRMASGGAQ